MINLILKLLLLLKKKPRSRVLSLVFLEKQQKLWPGWSREVVFGVLLGNGEDEEG